MLQKPAESHYETYDIHKQNLITNTLKYLYNLISTYLYANI